MTYYTRATPKPKRRTSKLGDVLKYNLNHDKLGRFAHSAEGGAGPLTGMYDRVAQPDGGFTYQPTLKHEPKEGFAVSPYPDRSFAKDAKDFRLLDLVKYVVKNKDVFKNPDHHIGAWHDPESGLVFLDVSVVVKTPAKARALALKHDQIAYFDLKKGVSVTVNRNATSGGVTGDKNGK